MHIEQMTSGDKTYDLEVLGIDDLHGAQKASAEIIIERVLSNFDKSRGMEVKDVEFYRFVGSKLVSLRLSTGRVGDEGKASSFYRERYHVHIGSRGGVRFSRPQKASVWVSRQELRDGAYPTSNY